MNHTLIFSGKGRQLTATCTCHPDRGGVWCYLGRYELASGIQRRDIIRTEWAAHVAWEQANPDAWL